MIESDIRMIESSLNMLLPEYYRRTMLDYPFPANSFANEFLLPNDPEPIIDYNQGSGEHPGIGKLFIIGSDGGEELYFVDLTADNSCVFTFDMETGKHTTKASDWMEYLRQVENELKEIKENEKPERERKANKKWWEFGK